MVMSPLDSRKEELLHGEEGHTLALEVGDLLDDIDHARSLVFRSREVIPVRVA